MIGPLNYSGLQWNIRLGASRVPTRGRILATNERAGNHFSNLYSQILLPDFSPISTPSTPQGVLFLGSIPASSCLTRSPSTTFAEAHLVCEQNSFSCFHRYLLGNKFHYANGLPIWSCTSTRLQRSSLHYTCVPDCTFLLRGRQWTVLSGGGRRWHTSNFFAAFMFCGRNTMDTCIRWKCCIPT